MKLARIAMTAIIAGSLLAVDSLAFSDPDAVREAKAKLDALREEISAIEQEGIEAGAKAEEARTQLERTQEDLKNQEAKVSKLADEIGGIAVMQMQHGNFDVTMKLLTSATDETFLSSLATIQSEAERSNANLQQFQNDQARLDLLRSQADEHKRKMDENLAEFQKRAEEYKAKEKEAEDTFKRLEKEEQERLERLRQEEERRREEQARQDALAQQRREAARENASRNETRASQPSGQAPKKAAEPAPAPAPNAGRAQTVINAAMAQVGKRYVYGTAGPSTFDCSGLTSYAYKQIGISLPRSSRAQYSGAGRRVPLSDIKPGDLVFYYGGPSHVGIYIGNGKIVHAANPRSGINVTGLHSMPLTGVRRVL